MNTTKSLKAKEITKRKDNNYKDKQNYQTKKYIQCKQKNYKTTKNIHKTLKKCNINVNLSR